MMARQCIVCFNPCYSGLWRIEMKELEEKEELLCFNPCYSGLWRISHQENCRRIHYPVLILVIVDYGGSIGEAMFDYVVGIKF